MSVAWVRNLFGGSRSAGIESAVGKKCKVVERISNVSGCGEAKVGGSVWSARSVSDAEVYEVGEVLRVVAIEGVRLVVKR